MDRTDQHFDHHIPDLAEFPQGQRALRQRAILQTQRELLFDNLANLFRFIRLGCPKRSFTGIGQQQNGGFPGTGHRPRISEGSLIWALPLCRSSSAAA